MKKGLTFLLILFSVLTAAFCFFYTETNVIVAPEIKIIKNVKILIVGDLMFDRGIRYYAKKNGGNEFIFNKIHDFLADYDLVLANLEGPITENKSVSSGTKPGSKNNYFFTFDPSVAKTLFDENIKLVSLGNNHILNFGKAGLLSTEKYLGENKIEYFGAPGQEKSITENIGKLKISFINYNQFSRDENEETATVDEIKKTKENSDIVIVFCHWGNEYQKTPTEQQKISGKEFIDAGADLVVGSHPHVIEPSEEYNGKKIYYSLGNFIFDQYFSKSVRNGLGLVVSINPQTNQMDFLEQKFYLDEKGQTKTLP